MEVVAGWQIRGQRRREFSDDSNDHEQADLTAVSGWPLGVGQGLCVHLSES